MLIRKMETQDNDQVYELWLSCGGMGLNNIDDSKEGVARFLKRNPKTCFVAQENDGIVGVILVGNDGRRAYIYHLAVHPEFRRQGIGTKLVNQAMKALKELGITKAALVAFSRNTQGNTFWEKLGFHERADLIYRDKALKDLVRIDT